MKFNNFLIIVIISLFAIIAFLSSSGNSKSEDYIFYNLDSERETFDKYKGKYSILTFTFNRCPSICPMINLELSKLHYKYGGDINIVSINVDPEHDTQELLLNYMKTNQYEWDILKGSVAEIERFMGDKLHSNRKLLSPSEHLPNLYLMDKDFNYIDKYFPESSETDKLASKLYTLLEL